MIIGMGDRPVVPIVALVLAGLVIAGCGSSGSSAGTPAAQLSGVSLTASGAPTSTPSVPTSTALTTPSPSPTVTALSTAAMKAALLPKSAAPAGYQLRHEGALPPTGELGCGRNGVTPQREVGADFEGGGLGTGAQIEELIRGYPSAAVAHKAMEQIVAFSKVCHRSGLYHVKPTSYPAVGALDVALSMVEELPGIGVTGRGQLAFALTGTTIVEVVVIGSPSVKAAPTLPIVRKAIAQLS